MILKLNQLKRFIPESFKHEYTIFPVPRPSTNHYPPYPPPPPDPHQCWYLEYTESQAQTKLVCNICMWQFHRKTANIDQGQGDLPTYLLHSETAELYFGFERVSCFWNHSVWTQSKFRKDKTICDSTNKATKLNRGNQIFCKVNEKEKKRNSKKTAKVWPSKAYPVGMDAITSRKTRIYKEKTKTIIETEKWKKRREVGRRYLGPTIE